MKLRYNWTLDDAIEFNWNFQRRLLRNPRVRMRRLIWLIVFSIAVAIVFEFFSTSALAGGIVGYLLTIVSLVYSPNRRIIAGQVRTFYGEGRNIGLFGEYELELTSNLCIWRTPERESSIRLFALERIDITPSHTIVYTSATNGIAIRRTAVVAGDYEAFAQELVTRWEREAFH